MIRAIYLTILLFFTANISSGQVLSKSQIDDYVSQVKSENNIEIHEGYIGKRTPYSYLLTRNEDKMTVIINESIGRNPTLSTDFFYLKGKVIYIKSYKYNRKKDNEKLYCEIYPTLNLINSIKKRKCNRINLEQNAIYMYDRNK